MEEDLPAEAHERYGLMIQRTKDITYATEKRGVPPEEVAKKVHKALTVRRPRARYLVGNAWLQRLIARRVPDRWRDALILKMAGMVPK
jgi:hypothetical protein